MVKISSVERGSVADKKGLSEGDVLLSINENPIADVLDYRFYLTEKNVVLRLLRDGTELTVRIKKGEYPKFVRRDAGPKPLQSTLRPHPGR